MKKLVVLGGGFAGAKIAKALENSFDLTLIDSKDYFEFTPGILKTIVNHQHFKKIQIPHKKYLKKARVITDKVKEITKKEVVLSKKNQKIIAFDYLVIALGSNYNPPFKEKNIIIITRINHLKRYYKQLEKSHEIVIIGGGIVGIELAGEITSKYPNKGITIIHKNDKLIERNHAKAISYADKFLRKKGVKFIFNENAISYKKNIIITDKETKIKADMVFLCTGIKPNFHPLEKNFKNVLNEKKQIKVNEFLQVENYKNIFAAGDITAVKEEKLAQNAEKQADIVIKNLINTINDKHLIKYQPKPRIMVISLGRFNGILQYKNFILTGIIPGILKSFVEWKTMTRYKI
ncbi:MAG: FAD-dependent oxidoreductase [Nanoarchaeota archaeon]